MFTTHAKNPAFLKAELFPIDSEFPGGQSQEKKQNFRISNVLKIKTTLGGTFQMFPWVPIKGAWYDVANHIIHHPAACPV